MSDQILEAVGSRWIFLIGTATPLLVLPSFSMSSTGNSFDLPVSNDTALPRISSFQVETGEHLHHLLSNLKEFLTRRLGGAVLLHHSAHDFVLVSCSIHFVIWNFLVGKEGNLLDPPLSWKEWTNRSQRILLSHRIVLETWSSLA